eukprot:4844374-Ditylum_brightwellii.AAC.1
MGEIDHFFQCSAEDSSLPIKREGISAPETSDQRKAEHQISRATSEVVEPSHQHHDEEEVVVLDAPPSEGDATLKTGQKRSSHYRKTPSRYTSDLSPTSR